MVTRGKSEEGLESPETEWGVDDIVQRRIAMLVREEDLLIPYKDCTDNLARKKDICILIITGLYTIQCCD